MLRRASHYKPVAQRHCHKWGISASDPRVLIRLPTTWRQYLPCIWKILYLIRSVTCQYICVGGHTPIMHGPVPKLTEPLVPLTPILTECLHECGTACLIDPEPWEEESSCADPVVDADVGDNLKRPSQSL